MIRNSFEELPTITKHLHRVEREALVCAYRMKFKKSALGFDFKVHPFTTYYAYFKSKRSKMPVSIIKENNGFVFEWRRKSTQWESLGPSGMRVFRECKNKGLLLEVALK